MLITVLLLGTADGVLVIGTHKCTVTHAVSIHQVMSLEEETGLSPGWVQNGGLFIASNKERYGLDSKSKQHAFTFFRYAIKKGAYVRGSSHAYTRNRLNEYKRLATHGQYYGIESEVLTPAEAKVCFVGHSVPVAVLLTMSRAVVIHIWGHEHAQNKFCLFHSEAVPADEC